MPTTVFQLSRVDSLTTADVIPAYISADGDTRGIEYGKLKTQIQTDLSANVTAALNEAQSLVTASEEVLESVTDISNEVQNALAAEDGAIAARLQAEAARDTAFINADVYEDVATGLAAVADGVQFQVVNADGLSIQRYRRDAGPVATAVGVPYPTAEAVAAVRRAQIGSVVESINLFDYTASDYAAGHRVNHTNGTTAVTAGYDASGYIVVKPSTAYRLTNRNRIAWYNAAKVFISGSDSNADPTVTSPAGAAYLRCSLHLGGEIRPAEFMVTETTAVPTRYVPFGGLIQPSRIIGLSADSIEDGGISPRKNSFLAQGKNLFNAATITADRSINAAGTIVTNAAYDLSDYIPVTAGLPYVANAAIRFYAAYDASKACIQSAGSNTQVNAGTTITPAANVAFLRITTYDGAAASFQFEQNTVQTGYEPYRFVLNPLVYVPPATVASTWANAKAASFGDSITDQNQWQPAVVTELGLDHTRYGVGGRRVSGASGMCQDAAINAMPTDRELILVLGGANDWANSVPLGAVTSTDTNEFYGALNQMCSKLTTRFPTATICLLTTTYAEYPGRAGWPDAITNTAGLSTRDYAQAIRVMGKRWGMPVIDLDQEGVNTVNVTTYRTSDGAYLHPNAAGGARIARIVNGALKTLEP